MTAGVRLSLLAFVLALAAGPAAHAASYTENCPFPSRPGEGFTDAINRCGDIARLDNLEALPETSARTWYSLGQLYQYDHQYEKAVESYTKALGWQAKVPAILVARGDAYATLGKEDMARADYAQADLVGPPGPADWTHRCWQRALRGSLLDAALADCGKALAASPGDAPALFARCVVQWRLGEFVRAREDCGAALAADPKLAGALYFRGLATRKSGDAAGGDADIAPALRMNRRLADGYAIFGLTP
jgi:tetratricopeptide (TPR) repeat protein